jgi:hypothetical protein
MPKKKIPDFTCSKCKQKFLGLDSFHGEFTIPIGETKEIKLCRKCLSEIVALLAGETRTIKRHIQEKIEYYTKQHGIDRYADAKRTAYEEISEYLTENCTIFNGYNNKARNGKDLSQLELTARSIIHDDFNINFTEQVILSYSDVYRYKVDGLILTGKKKWLLSLIHHTITAQSSRKKRTAIKISC